LIASSGGGGGTKIHFKDNKLHQPQVIPWFLANHFHVKLFCTYSTGLVLLLAGQMEDLLVHVHVLNFSNFLPAAHINKPVITVYSDPSSSIKYIH